MIADPIVLDHITLNTGHSSRPTRDAVDADVLSRVEWDLRSRIVPPRLGTQQPILHFGAHGYIALTLTKGETLTQTVTGGDGAPLVTFGVAPGPSPDADVMWNILLDVARAQPGASVPRSMPRSPWCAVVIWSSIALHPKAVTWLGDYERCVAFA